MVEDRRIGGEPRHREIVDIVFERTAIEQIACDIVQPETLAQVMKQLCRFHLISCGKCGTGFSAVPRWNRLKSVPHFHRFSVSSQTIRVTSQLFASAIKSPGLSH